MLCDENESLGEGKGPLSHTERRKLKKKLNKKRKKEKDIEMQSNI
jgi:hypothetical protein